MSMAGEVQHAAEIYITGHANEKEDEDDDEEEKELSVHLDVLERSVLERSFGIPANSGLIRRMVPHGRAI